MDSSELQEYDAAIPYVLQSKRAFGNGDCHAGTILAHGRGDGFHCDCYCGLLHGAGLVYSSRTDGKNPSRY